MLLLVLIAVFAPLITRPSASTGTSPIPRRPTRPTSWPSTAIRRSGPPFYAFTWDHPLGVAPRKGYDNLAYLVYGLRTSLVVALTATIASTFIGVASA